MAAESAMLSQVIAKAQDTITRYEELERMVCVSSENPDIVDLVGAVKENTEFMKKVLTTRIESWQLKKAEIDSTVIP
jgi:hypothetical protein